VAVALASRLHVFITEIQHLASLPSLNDLVNIPAVRNTRVWALLTAIGSGVSSRAVDTPSQLAGAV